MSKMGKRIIRDLREFVGKLKRGEPIEVVQIRREETPDGPMHTRRKEMWTPPKKEKS